IPNPSDARGIEERLYYEFQERRSELEQRINEAVLQELGPNFEVRDVQILRGSVLILVVIGTIYATIAQYPDFLQGLERISSQIKQALRTFSGAPNPVSVRGHWNPSPAVRDLQNVSS